MATELAKDRTQKTIMESKDSEKLYLGTITESHEGMVIAREARQWLKNWDEVGDGKGQESNFTKPFKPKPFKPGANFTKIINQ